MNKLKSSIWLPLIVAVVFVAGLWIGSALSSDKATIGSVKKLGDIIGLINDEYVEPVNVDSLVEATIPQLLEKLDPHSTYIPASDLKAVNDELEGSFYGIGITFMMMNDTITILEVI